MIKPSYTKFLQINLINDGKADQNHRLRTSNPPNPIKSRRRTIPTPNHSTPHILIQSSRIFRESWKNAQIKKIHAAQRESVELTAEGAAKIAEKTPLEAELGGESLAPKRSLANEEGGWLLLLFSIDERIREMEWTPMVKYEREILFQRRKGGH